MRKTMLTTTALACLLVGSQVALAQSPEPKRDEQKQGTTAPPAQQEQKRTEDQGSADRTASQPKNAPGKAQNQESAKESNKNPRAGQAAQGASKADREGRKETKETEEHDGSGQLRNSSGSEKSKSTSASERPKEGQGTRAQRRQQPSQAQPSAAENTKPTTNDRSNAQQPAANNQPNNATTSNNPQTNGSTSTNAAAQLTPQKQQRITETIQRTQIAPPVRDLNVAISVGTRVPSRVRLYRLPPEIVSIEPQYRDYQYFTTENDIVIVEPRSHHVVSTIARRSSAAGVQTGDGAKTSMASAGGSACQIMRRDPSGELSQVNPSDLAPSTVGSASQSSSIAVTVQTGNGESTQPIPLGAPAGQITVASQGNGDCKVTIEPGPSR